MCHPRHVLDQAKPTVAPTLEEGRDAGTAETDEHLDRRQEVVRLVIAGAVALLAIAAVGALIDGLVTWVDVLQAALVMILGIGLLIHDRLAAMIAERRRSRESGMTRILQGLSRSMSPEAVVEAIVAELRSTSGADHVVVARLRRPDHVVEVTLVTARANVPPSRTWLRPDVPELSSDVVAPTPPPVLVVPPHSSTPDATQGRSTGSPSGNTEPTSQVDDSPSPATPARIAAEEIARRVRSAYGLPFTLTEPLVTERRFLGALILSRRTREPFADPERRLLGWAAREVAAAFSRAYTLEDAERGANLDPLTGLPNRRYFDELLAIMGPPSPGYRQPRHHDDRHRPLQAAQRPVRARPRGRRAAGGGVRHRPDTAGRGHARPVWWRGVRRDPAAGRRSPGERGRGAGARSRGRVARHPAGTRRPGDRVGGRGHRGRGRGGECS